MSKLEDVEASAMALPDRQRAELAAHLLGSLPAMLQDDDEGVAEALRRDVEIDADSSVGMSMDDFKKAIGR